MELPLGAGSYFVIVLVLAASGLGLPVPEEVPVIAAGVLASQGTLDPYAAFAACLLGAILGDSIVYAIGHHFGRRMLRSNHRWLRFVTPQREAMAERMIRRHGFKVFLGARFVVGLRTPVYLAAGILRIPYRRFLLIDLIAASTVIGVFFVLSHYWGETIAGWVRRTEIAVAVALLVILASAALYLFGRRRRRRRHVHLAVPNPSTNGQSKESSRRGLTRPS